MHERENALKRAKLPIAPGNISLEPDARDRDKRHSWLRLNHGHEELTASVEPTEVGASHLIPLVITLLTYHS